MDNGKNRIVSVSFSKDFNEGHHWTKDENKEVGKFVGFKDFYWTFYDVLVRDLLKRIIKHNKIRE